MKQVTHTEIIQYELQFIDEELDDEYWSQQPQVTLSNYSGYIIYPKQGLIWGKKSNRFIGNKDKNGYLHCSLYADDGTVWKTCIHRVIWITVKGEIPKGMQVNHIDENKENNSISNLNIMTPKENMNWGSRNE